VIGGAVRIHRSIPLPLILVRHLSPLPSAPKRWDCMTRLVAVNALLVQGRCGNAGYPAAPSPSGPSMSASGTFARVDFEDARRVGS
jgi:hypothetical protein